MQKPFQILLNVLFTIKVPCNCVHLTVWPFVKSTVNMATHSVITYVFILQVPPSPTAFTNTAVKAVPQPTAMPVPHAPPTAPIPSMGPVVPESSGMGTVPRKVSQPIAPGMGDNTSLSSYGTPSGGISQGNAPPPYTSAAPPPYTSAAPVPPPPPPMVNQPPPPPPPPVSQQQPMGMPPHMISGPPAPYNTPPTQPKMMAQPHMMPTMAQKMGQGMVILVWLLL